MLGSQGTTYSALSVLFLRSPGGGPREDSARGRLRSSCFSATRASVATYCWPFVAFSSIVVGGRSTSDQKRREGLIPIMNAWITSDGCASRMALISFVKRARSKPPLYASSVGGRKCYGMGVSWISWIKGEPQRGLSPRSSFILMVLWTESVESEESVSGSGGLRADALGVDVGCLTASPEGALLGSGESWGRLSVGCIGITPVGARGAAWGYELGCWASCKMWGMIAWSIPAITWTWCGEAGSHLRTKVVEAGVAGLPPRLVASWERHLPRGCRVLSVLATWSSLRDMVQTSSPPSSAKILLDDPSCPRSQHDMVQPARIGTT
ncbi:hypothetical protein BHM03_00029106 [Ensete ventricosum]|nr:hypothetical protein BHM03_00029106 [Ensete ventricosum]